MEARLLKYEELLDLGCSSSSCTGSSAYSFLYLTDFWTGTARDDSTIYGVLYYAQSVSGNDYASTSYLGVRPVIRVLKSEF